MFKRRMNPEQRHSRINPLVAARTAALALSASRVGSLSAGFYCGVLLTNVLNLQLATAAQRAIFCAITVVVSIVTVIVALWLERMCRLPEPPRETDSIAR